MTAKIDPIAYYDSQASVFASQASDRSANRFEYEKNMPSLLTLIDTFSGDVLDFGCGAGNFTAMLQRQDRVVDGSDTSPRLLDIARQNYPSIDFISSSSDGRVETNKKYNLVVAKLVFHYIIDLDTVLANLNTQLEAGGHLVFSVPHPDKTQHHFPSTVEEGEYVDEVGNFGLTLPMIHRTLGKLSTQITDNGFGLVDLVTVCDEEKPKRLNVLAKKL
jgi:trans-aconitate methyltransferase